MNHKGYLLATVGGFAAAATAGGAQAADLAMKTPMVMAPAVSWAGWYVGLSAGANWQAGLNSGNDGYADGASTSGSGFIGGGQIGYNWQDGNFVYGLEGDISGLTGKGTSAINTNGRQWSNQISWLSTIRARTGLAVGNTMAYVTGGVAIGGVKNSYSDVATCCGGGTKSESNTRVGWAVGGGIEHMIAPNWTIALEAMFVDLGASTANGPDGKTSKFSNQAVIGRFKVNYKF